MSDTPLTLTKSQLEKHWGILLSKLKPVFTNCYFDKQEVSGIYQAQIACPQAHRAIHFKSHNTPVVQLNVENRKNNFWLSWYEKWELIAKGDVRTPKYQFGSSAITIFSDLVNGESGPKVQIFRAEWVGSQENGEGGFTWPSDGAGHPHWQVDLAEYYISEIENLEKYRQLKSDEEIKDFTPSSGSIKRILSVEALHLASNAAWAKYPWTKGQANPCHIQNPEEPEEIANWVTSTINYITLELSKL
jgi:hypothetical protein